MKFIVIFCLEAFSKIMSMVLSALETVVAIVDAVNKFMDDKFGEFVGSFLKFIVWSAVTIILTPVALICVSLTVSVYDYLDEHGFHLFFLAVSTLALVVVFVVVNWKYREPPAN